MAFRLTASAKAFGGPTVAVAKAGRRKAEAGRSNSALRQRQREPDARAALIVRHVRHPAVVRDDDLLDEGQAETGAARFGREERAEHALGDSGRNARTVVGDGHADGPLFTIDRAFEDDVRGHAR